MRIMSRLMATCWLLAGLSPAAHADLQRFVYDGADVPPLPGVLVRSEGEPPTGNNEVDSGYDYVGDAYDYFLEMFGRDGWDDKGSPVELTVGTCLDYVGFSCIGTTSLVPLNKKAGPLGLVMGTLSTMDDTLAAEYAVGVIESSSEMVYFGETGAIAQGYAFTFGEVVDLTNGVADVPGGRWYFGDDVFYGLLGQVTGIKNFIDPNEFGDPAKMSDPLFQCGHLSEGGIYANSSLITHAFALTTDGGAFNGHDITGIGIEKAGRIYYRTVTELLPRTATFLDNYNAVQQACKDLVGTHGITQSDCIEVKKALDAVEMWMTIPCAGACPAEPLTSCDESAPGKRTRLTLIDRWTSRDTLSWDLETSGIPIDDAMVDPRFYSTQAMCLYDHSGPDGAAVLKLEAKANIQGLWKPLAGGGWSARYPSRLPDGVRKISLKNTQSGTTRIRVAAKGENLAMPDLNSIEGPLKAQLFNTFTEHCWSTDYDTPVISPKGDRLRAVEIGN